MFKRGCNGCGEFWYIGNDSTCKCPDETPKREWVGLTDDEEIELDEKYGDDFNAYIEARDAKLKEKNT
jgi:hypothetical protein